VASGALVFLFLRRLGYAPWAGWAATAAFGLTPSFGLVAATVFLVDPLTLVFELLLLLALESAAGAGVLALIAAAGALTKEVFLLFLPVIYFARRGRDGHRRALLLAAAAFLAALLATAAVRSWNPYPGSGAALPDAASFWLGVYRILSGWDRWAESALLAGVMPLAVLGALRGAARPFLARYGYLLLVALALPFAASVYTDDRRTVPFFAEDVPRLLLLALPVLLPLALLALDRLRPCVAPAAPVDPAPPGSVEVSAAVAALVLATAPLWLLDSYRRVDLSGPRDGRLVLALTRESRSLARRLEHGKAVALRPELRHFTPGRSDPHLLEQMRWFLREGWGPLPQYGVGPLVMRASEASLLLPCLRPAEWELKLLLSARPGGRIEVWVNQQRLGEASPGAEPALHAFQVPAAALFRGDNLVRLLAADGARARLHDVLLRPLS
jgi:hypothetical protein